MDRRSDVHFGQLLTAGGMEKPHLGAALEGDPDPHAGAHHAGDAAVAVLAHVEGVLEGTEKRPGSGAVEQRAAGTRPCRTRLRSCRAREKVRLGQAQSTTGAFAR